MSRLLGIGSYCKEVITLTDKTTKEKEEEFIKRLSNSYPTVIKMSNYKIEDVYKTEHDEDVLLDILEDLKKRKF